MEPFVARVFDIARPFKSPLQVGGFPIANRPTEAAAPLYCSSSLAIVGVQHRPLGPQALRLTPDTKKKPSLLLTLFDLYNSKPSLN